LVITSFTVGRASGAARWRGSSRSVFETTPTMRPCSSTGAPLIWWYIRLRTASSTDVLAATVNNLPAVLVLLPLVAVPGGGPGAVLAVLIGVNIGPNLTYTGSLATLLWRRVLRESDTDVALGEFTRLGVATVVPALLLCVICLWLSLRA